MSLSKEAIGLALAELVRRETTVWQMAQNYIDTRDAHGVMDMGSELEALGRCKLLLLKLRDLA